MNTYIATALQIIANTYSSMLAFLYQHITQTQFTNNTLATYTIDYTLLLPSSQYLTNLNTSQVNAQVQSYIDLCTALITYIVTTDITQSNIFYEQIQNTLNNSITQLNSFATSLLEAEYASVIFYQVPYGMSLTTAMFLNTINQDSWQKQVSLNPTTLDFNNLIQGTTLQLLKG